MLFEKFNLLGQEVVLPVLCDKDNIPIIDKEKKYSKKGFIPDVNSILDIVNETSSLEAKINNRENIIKNKKQEKQDLELNTSEWKEFKVGNIFEKLNVEKYNKEPKEGTLCNFVSASSFNNGVVKKVNKKSFDKPCLTITTDGACFDVFYQKTPIAVSTNVEILYSEVLNEYNALFIATILRMEQFKWSYGRKPKNDKVFETYIKLPIKKDINNIPYIDISKKYSKEGYIPDWKFMENYMKSLNYELPKTKNSAIPDIELGLFEWKEFEVKNILKQINITKYNKKPEEEIGDIPFITAAGSNNGMSCYCNYKDNIGNCITVSTNGVCFDVFYHQDSVAVSSDVEVLTMANLTPAIALFLCTVLGKEQYKWSYGRKPKNGKVLSTIIKLPIKQNLDGTPYISKEKKCSKEGYVPNWEFMGNYIKSFPYGDII